MIKIKLLIVFVFIFWGLKSQQLVSNISPGLNSSNPVGVYPFKNDIVFAANDGFNGLQLYFTDGTANGTVRLTNIQDPPQTLTTCRYLFGGKISNFKEIDSLGYFFSEEIGNTILMKTDGTPQGTEAISEPLVIMEASRFFKLEDQICSLIKLLPSAGGEPFNHMICYNPVNKETTILNVLSANIYEILTDDRVFNTRADHLGQFTIIPDPIVMNNRVYYASGGFIKSMDIFGNVLQHDLGYNSGILLNNKLIMSSNVMLNVPGDLSYFDFTTGTTFQLKDVNPYFNYGCNPVFAHLPYLDDRQHDKVYFTAQHEDYGYELWVTDGTEAGTKIVKDNVLGPMDGISYTSYLDQYVFYRGDTLTMFNWNLANEIFETDGFYWQTINYDPGMQGIMEDGYKWNVNSQTYAINYLGILYVVNNNSLIAIDTLDVNSCGWSHSYYFTDYFESGWIYKSGCKLYYAFEDCEFTGIELYVSDFVCNGVLSLEKINSLSISCNISPNPTSDEISISISEQFLGAEFTLYDQLGKALIKGNLLGVTNTVDLTSLARGIYFLSIEGMTELERVIKK
jgi:ELWxxDGT repeat protein